MDCTDCEKERINLQKRLDTKNHRRAQSLLRRMATLQTTFGALGQEHT